MAVTAALGRTMFSFVFLAGALEKWRALRIDGADAAIVEAVAPALRAMKSSVSENVGVDLCSMLPSDYACVRIATAMELFGAALFTCGYALGAKMLLLFTLGVTPIVHPFWRRAAEGSAISDEASVGVEMIMFFKNLALAGALVFWLGMRSELAEERQRAARREKEKSA